MSESFTTNEKVAIFDRLYSYLTDPMGHDDPPVESELEKTKADNAKLRELVNDMWICIAHGSEGWDCTGCRRDPDNVCIMGISEFSHRMRELGIEVE